MSRVVVHAEDHADTRDIYVDVLAAAGFKVYVATSTASIGHLVRQHKVDLVIMDLSLAGTRVADVLTAAHAAGPRAPRLIAVSSRALEGETREVNFAKYLLKPVPPDALVAAVREVLTA